MNDASTVGGEPGVGQRDQSTHRGAVTGDARHGPVSRNPGAPLDLDWALAPRANPAAVQRRALDLGARRAVSSELRTAWLLRAVTCLDLTTLAGADTPGRVRRLAAKARNPVRADVLSGLGAGDVTVGALCVYHSMVEPATQALAGSGVPVCAVSTGFPAAQTALANKIDQIERSVAAGAQEIDIVISRPLVLAGRWGELYTEVARFREACGPAHMKAILAAGDLSTLRQVAQAGRVCLLAGADFIKTSTGKESVNAVLPFGLVMAGAIRDYRRDYGHAAGLKPAGGIATAQQVLQWMLLVHEELGPDWLTPARFRIGASSVLTDIEVALETAATGRPSVARRHPPG